MLHKTCRYTSYGNNKTKICKDTIHRVRYEFYAKTVKQMIIDPLKMHNYIYRHENAMIPKPTNPHIEFYMEKICKTYLQIKIYTNHSMQHKNKSKGGGLYLKLFLYDISWGFLPKDLQAWALAKLGEAGEGEEGLEKKGRS